MPNMSYCRFRNTLLDLRDCVDNIHDENISNEENEARAKLVSLCEYIAIEYGSVFDDENSDLDDD